SGGPGMSTSVSSASGALAPLQFRDFRYLAAANAISVLGDNVVTIALSFAVLDLTGSISDLGLVLLARISATLTFVLVGGVSPDRVARRGLMVTADVGRATIQGILALLLLSGHAQIWMLVVLQFAHGTAGAFFRPAGSAVLPLLLPAEHRQPGN